MNKFNIDVNKLEFVRTKKITFKGRTKEENVYRIPINQLYYNDLNGRIATFISQYKSQKNKSLDSLSLEEYNDLIAQFIKSSSTKERYKKTKDDIKLSTQKEPGVVLSDGRIIDGNRRYTCLRDLFNETGDSRYGFFEAIVLVVPPEDDVNSWKAINSLELELQIGTDEKVDYGPIDWLVKVYQDLIKSKSYTITEYSRITKYTESEIKKMITKAEIMVDFLDFFNKPEAFHIAKSLELDGPLTELVKLKRKYSNQSDWDEIKIPFYMYLWQQKKGDRSRDIRKIIKLVDTDKFEIILENGKKEASSFFANEIKADYKEIESNDLNNEKRDSCVISNENARTLSSNKPSFSQQVSEIIQDANSDDAIKKPLDCCKSALKNLNDIDKDIVRMWTNWNMKNEYRQLLEDLEDKIKELKR